MGRLEKLKAQNMKKANDLLDKGHRLHPEQQKQVFRPSNNVTNSSQSFVNKMSRLKEEKHLNEEPEKDTYWMITKANRDNLITMGGTAEEIGKSATNNFKKYCK